MNNENSHMVVWWPAGNCNFLPPSCNFPQLPAALFKWKMPIQPTSEVLQQLQSEEKFVFCCCCCFFCFFFFFLRNTETDCSSKRNHHKHDAGHTLAAVKHPAGGKCTKQKLWRKEIQGSAIWPKKYQVRFLFSCSFAMQKLCACTRLGLCFEWKNLIETADWRTQHVRLPCAAENNEDPNNKKMTAWAFIIKFLYLSISYSF